MTVCSPLCVKMAVFERMYPRIKPILGVVLKACTYLVSACLCAHAYNIFMLTLVLYIAVWVG